MKKIEISYNPYKMKTRMKIDGVDVCQSSDYSDIKKFIEQGTPLQTWIEPITYLGWDGFVNEISDPENNDEVGIIFSGRKIDFQDLQRAIEEQNVQRELVSDIIMNTGKCWMIRSCLRILKKWYMN